MFQKEREAQSGKKIKLTPFSTKYNKHKIPGQTGRGFRLYTFKLWEEGICSQMKFLNDAPSKHWEPIIHVAEPIKLIGKARAIATNGIRYIRKNTCIEHAKHCHLPGFPPDNMALSIGSIP